MDDQENAPRAMNVDAPAPAERLPHDGGAETARWKSFGRKQEELSVHGREAFAPRAPTNGQDHVDTVKDQPPEGEGEDEDEDNPFSQYYGMLLHQQNMLQDHVRTSTYERAMLENRSDFAGKVVLDVGTGSGILAYFAVKAGARHVYAVELSAMAHCARELLAANGLGDRITVLKGKMEAVELPEPVDVVVSEPMGFFLVHERMLETYVNAGKKWRRPGGKMFPSTGTMFVAPFSDESIYREQMGKVAFWQQRDFYGLDLSSMRARAIDNHFSQPVVGYFPPEILLTTARVTHEIDFGHVADGALEVFDIPFDFIVERTAIMHGLACWFTVDFIGSTSRVVLSTAPDEPGTHWYQCRLLLPTPIAVNATQRVTGNLHFVANKKFSYDIDLTVHLEGTAISATNRIRLHDQMYHYLYSPSGGNPGAHGGGAQAY